MPAACPTRQIPSSVSSQRPELLLRFIELAVSTEGKDPEPIRRFREQLRRRGIIG